MERIAPQPGVRTGSADQAWSGLELRNFRRLDGRQRAIACWYWCAAAICAGLVLAIPGRWYFPDLLGPLAAQLRLTHENNFAAWWSGILLFMLALHAYDAGRAQRQRAPQIAAAWTTMAAIFLFLSADEMGSLHERISGLSMSLGLGRWTLLALLGGAIATALLHSLRTLWQGGNETRPMVLPLLTGFAVLGSVFGQEIIEYWVDDWGGGPMIWIRSAVEEGSELLGMMILLRVLLQPSMGILASRASAGQRLFGFLQDHSANIFVLLVGLAPLLALAAGQYADERRGHMSDWLASVVFLTAGLAWMNRVVTGNVESRRPSLVLASLCLLASLASMAIQPFTTVQIGSFQIPFRTLALAMICLLFCGLWLNAKSELSRNPTGFVVGVCVWLLLSPILGSGILYSFLTTQIFAVLILGITCVSAVESADKTRQGVRNIAPT